MAVGLRISDAGIARPTDPAVAERILRKPALVCLNDQRFPQVDEEGLNAVLSDPEQKRQGGAVGAHLLAMSRRRFGGRRSVGLEVEKNYGLGGSPPVAG